MFRGARCRRKAEGRGGVRLCVVSVLPGFRAGALENVTHSVEPALGFVRRELDRDDAEVERRRLAEFEMEIENTARLAARVSKVEAEARATLDRSPEERRRLFDSLLGGRRMRVLAERERAYRVEGIFELPWRMNAPSEPVDSRGGIGGSGGGI